MKLRDVFPSLAMGLVLGASAGSSGALTLGRLHGAAFIGQPLDVKVNVQWDASEAVDATCFAAEVLHADAPQDTSRISLHLEPLAGAGTPAALLRIQSQSVIDEPVVTINLRGGCQAKTLRRYVVLADVATGVVAPPPAPSLPLVSATPAPRTAVAVAAPVAASGDVGTAVLPPSRTTSGRDKSSDKGDAPKLRTSRTARTAHEGAVLVSPDTVSPPPAKVPVATPSPAPTRKSPPVALAPERGRGKSRLKLEALDLSIDYDPVLRASSEMLSAPQEDLAKRAQAQLWWKQLNASPEDVLREAAQVQQLSQELKALRDLTAENQKGLVDLEARVQRAQDERYANPLVYGLGAALLLSMLALVWVWRRPSRAAHHWSEGLAEPDSDSLLSELHDQDSVLVAAVEQAELSEPKPARHNMTSVDIDIDAPGAAAMAMPGAPAAPKATAAPAQPATASPVASKVLRTHDPRAARKRDFQESSSAELRSIDSEEVIDVREQAEFFMSLGQHDKAVEVLTSRIALCGESSPLVCLDLLKILHVLGRKADYDFMRAEFHIWFTGRVPEFGQFDDPGQSLEAYPHVLNRIVDLWPGVRALEFIEDCLFHHQGEDDDVQFDISAYRDLLLLHAVAKRIVRITDDVAASEPIRVPARAKTLPEREDANLATPRAVTHRAGAHLRGTWTRPDAADAPELDPQADIETRGVPLGAMQVPPNLINPDSQVVVDVDLDSANAPLTNFDFLNMRRS